MGDAERQFKIKISTDLDASGAKQAATGMEELSQKTEHAEVSHRALRVALRQLGPEFSEVGHTALYAFANPITAAVIGITFAVGEVIKHIGDLEKKAIETGRELDERLARMRDGWNKVTEEITESDDKFADWYNHLDDRTGKLLQRFDQLKTQIHNLTEGSIPKGVLEEQAIEGLLRRAMGEEASAKEKAETAHIDATDPLRAQRIAARRDRIGDLNKEIQRRTENEPGFMDVVREFATPFFLDTEFRRKLAERRQQFQEVPELRRRALEMESEQRSDVNQRREAELAEARAKKAAEDASAQVKSLQDRVGQPLAGTFSPETLAHLGAVRAGVSSGLPGGSLFRDVIEGEQAVGMGQRMTVSQQSAVASLTNMLQRQGATQQSIINLLLFLQNITITFDEKIKAIEARLRNLANRPT